uniref:Cytochrome c oxidase subunit 2 n=1 Tax=Glaucocystis nostochinearum TaxID=38271 RepID=E9P6B8_9EUKA|nr:cytochrome c oxidase subunit 2 [Glaucocystis nostochinearum]ADW83102.1 cytochrome c oxidase subunit 2 [Glaucocystis nostochinearum]
MKSFMNNFVSAATSWQMLFQDPNSPIMEGLINLHHDLMFFLILIAIFVAWMLGRTLWFFYYKKNSVPSKIVHGTFLEIAWTITPSLILLLLVIPSYALLYSMDELIDPKITLKVIGRQWYWSYEYSDTEKLLNKSIEFDSYMVPEDDLKPGQLRLLQLDDWPVLPIETHVRVLVTAADVLHSWAIPSLGIKVDATPGRLNQVSLFLKNKGFNFGQCSELCGANHAFMPIAIQGVNVYEYLDWIFTKTGVISK